MSDHVQDGLIPQPDADEDQGSNFLDRGVIWLGKKLSLMFALIVVISCYEIARRYIFNSPTLWVHETATFLGASLFVFGGLYAFATDKHVRVVLVYDSLSERARCAMRLVHHVFGLAFCAMMLYASWITAKKAVVAPWGALRLETSGSAWNPPFPAYLKVLILVGIIVLTLQFILHLIRDVRQLGRH